MLSGMLINGGLQLPLYKCIRSVGECYHAFKEDMHLGSKHQGMCCRWIMLKRGALHAIYVPQITSTGEIFPYAAILAYDLVDDTVTSKSSEP